MIVNEFFILLASYETPWKEDRDTIMDRFIESGRVEVS